MNIEDERKAYAEWYELDSETTELDVNGEFVDYQVSECFKSWLAAKAHAEEMAKPTVKLSQSAYYGWTVSLWVGGCFDGVLRGDLADKAEALQWAKDNGYRVVSE